MIEFLGIFGLIFAILFVIVGLVVLVVIIGSLIYFFPATIVGILVWYLTGDFFWGALAFLVIALFMIVFRR